MDDWIVLQVRFLNGRVKAIHPDIFTENIVGVGATCRIQMPLRIAFAISIHKVSPLHVIDC